MKIGRAKLVNRQTETKGKKYDKYFIFITRYVAKDEDFPFTVKDELIVEIVDKTLVIKKSK